MSTEEVRAPRLPAQLVRFGVVGVAATATHAGVLTAAIELAGFDAKMANAVAFLAAVLVTYLGQSFWVFRVVDHAPRRIGKFFAVACFGLAGNVLVMATAVDLLGFHYIAGFMAGTILIPAATFLANKLWVFRS